MIREPADYRTGCSRFLTLITFWLTEIDLTIARSD
jgi:hypothetical protein